MSDHGSRMRCPGCGAADDRSDAPVRQARRHRFAVDTQRILQIFYRAGGIDLRFDSYGRVRSVNLVPQRPD